MPKNQAVRAKDYFILLWCSGDGTLGLMHVRQLPSPLSYTPSPRIIGYLSQTVNCLFCSSHIQAELDFWASCFVVSWNLESVFGVKLQDGHSRIRGKVKDLVLQNLTFWEFSKDKELSWTWWYTPLISALQRQRQVQGQPSVCNEF